MTRTCTYMDPHNALACTECGRGVELCQCVNPEGAAHDRLHSPDGIVITMIRGELDAARGEYPEGQHALAALLEEAGKLARGLIKHDRAQEVTIQEVLRRAVTTAAMAIRIATEGDTNFLYAFPTVEEDLPRGPVTDKF